MKDTPVWISFDLTPASIWWISCWGKFSSTTFFYFSVLSYLVENEIVACCVAFAYHFTSINCRDSGEELVTNSYPRFIVGIQLGSVVSYKDDGFPLMKCFLQTCNVEFFSASWQVVKFLQLKFDSHWLLLSLESSLDLLSVVTMLGKRKNSASGSFFLLSLKPATPQVVLLTMFS